MRIGLDGVGRRAAALGLALAAVGLAGDAASQEPPGALVMGGDAPELFLLYSGDVIGYLEPCG